MNLRALKSVAGGLLIPPAKIKRKNPHWLETLLCPLSSWWICACDTVVCYEHKT